jgi:hypothetical protein
MTKAIQDIYKGKVEFITWAQLNDPRCMEPHRAQQAQELPLVQDQEAERSQTIEDYFNTGDWEEEIDPDIFSTHKVYEDRPVADQQRAKTEAAENKALDEMVCRLWIQRSRGNNKRSLWRIRKRCTTRMSA